MDHYLFRQIIAVHLLGTVNVRILPTRQPGISNELFIERQHHKPQVPLPKRKCKCKKTTRNQCGACTPGLFLCGPHFMKHWAAE